MIVTRYKPLFSLSVTLETTPEAAGKEGLWVTPADLSVMRMQDLHLKPKSAANTCTVYFEGKEDPADDPVSSIPAVLIDTDEYFYFTVSFRDNAQLGRWQFHSDDEAAKAAGFPLLYDAEVTDSGPPAVLSVAAREDVKVMNPVFTFVADLPQSGIAGEFASLEIRDENNQLIDLRIAPAKRNDKEDKGPGAIPEFAFSVDASALPAGIYELKAGNYKKKYFFATRMNIQGAALLVRVLKNEMLGYVTSLEDPDYIQFSLLIPEN